VIFWEKRAAQVNSSRIRRCALFNPRCRRGGARCGAVCARENCFRPAHRSRGNDAHVAWSPDGEHIVFATERMGFKDEVTYTRLVERTEKVSGSLSKNQGPR